MPDELKIKLVDASKNDRRSLTAYILVAIEKYLKEIENVTG